MSCITRNVVRLVTVAGTVVAVVGIPAVLIAGPDRVAAVFDQARGQINHQIDAAVGDPAAIRAQLRKLESEYPERIGEVRQDLAELDHQVGQMERELAVSQKVVQLAEADLSQLGAMIERAEHARADNEGFAVVRVRFDDKVLGLDETYAESTRIGKLREAHALRVRSIERDLGLVGQQRDRLASVLTQLETEQSELRDQLWQIEQQVDTIARNDRIIDLLEDRNESIERLGNYEAKTLDHVTGKIMGKLAEQEQRLAALAGQPGQKDYVAQAEYELDVMVRAGRALSTETQPNSLSQSRTEARKVIELQAPVIEISPDSEPVLIDRTGKSDPVARRE